MSRINFISIGPSNILFFYFTFIILLFINTLYSFTVLFLLLFYFIYKLFCKEIETKFFNKLQLISSIKRKIVSEDCPKCCPCCGVNVSSFSHWIFACKELENYRNKSLPFLDDLFLKFAMIIEQKSLDVFLDSEKDYDNNIYYYILSALLGGRSIYSKIKVNNGEQRQLVDNIFKQSSTSSTVPYFVGIAEFPTNVIPLTCRSFRLMMKWYSVESTVTKSVDVEMINHEFSPPGERSDTDSFNNTNTEIITCNNGRGVIIDDEES